MKKYILLFLIPLCVVNGFSQGNILIAAGLGYPEAAQIGVRYQIDQFQVAASFGIDPTYRDSYRTYAQDAYYHFGRENEISYLKKWYVRMGIMYVRDESVRQIDKTLFLNTRIGRACALSESFTIEYDFGLAIQVYNEYVDKPYTPPSNGGWELGFDPFEYVYPAFGITILFQL